MARWAHVQSCLFPFMREELDPCTEALEQLIIVLDTIGLEAYVPSPPSSGRGRKPDDRRALARAFIAKAMFSMPTTVSLIERLAVDKSLRRICGWETRREVPSESTFSRAFEEFAQSELPARMHEALVRRSLGNSVMADQNVIETNNDSMDYNDERRLRVTLTMVPRAALPLPGSRLGPRQEHIQ